MLLPSFLTAHRWAIVGLALVSLGGLYTLLHLESSPVSTMKTRTEPPSVRRGDDPTYAEELRTMTALLQDMRYRFDQTENQRILDRERAERALREATQQAAHQSKEEVGRLDQALREAREAADQKIRELSASSQDPTLKREIERLTEEVNTLRANPPARAGERGASDLGNRSGAARSEANRVLSPPDDVGRHGTDGPAPSVPPLAPGVLDSLRNTAGLEGLADRLSTPVGETDQGSSTSRPKRPASPTRLTTGMDHDYLTVTPYFAAGGAARSLASAHRAPVTSVSYQPKRYPFTVKVGREGASAVIPVYTIPDAATLVHNSMMTPLIGRVPFLGRLTDPFRFKLITGAENLAANGLRIPGVANAVWTGYAVGVREQSCVRAYLDTVTFVFEDGRIHTVHRGKGLGAVGSVSVSVNQNLGYLTDPWGKPCIRGQFFDNAGRYLKDRGMAAFLDELANAYANAQVTTDRSVYGLNSYMSGNTYEYAAAQGLSGTTSEIADYVRERASDAFDVVYVPPGQGVQIFVEAEIPIDYDTEGRKLQYAYDGQGDFDAPLD